MPCRSALAVALVLVACAAQPAPSPAPAPQASRPIAPPPFPDTQGGPLSAEQEQAARSYGALLRAAKADPASMDWAALRRAYAASPAYNPAVGNNPSMRPELTAAAAGDWTEVAALCEAALARNWMNMPAHFMAAKAYQRLGNLPAAAPHAAVTQAFLHGILAGGNGASPATAYPVLATIEEYIMLSIAHARMQKQSLLNNGGHFYDALQFVRPPSPTVGTMYFAIDTMFARESKLATGASLITDDQIPD